MDQKADIILSTAYFPPVYYLTKILNSEKVYIEQYEHYTKRSYRNRCDILSPNGKQSLSIPVKKRSGEKQLIKDIKIDYKNDWQSLHLKSIKTAYLSSPFFEFYIDAFMVFFNKTHTFLFDLNMKILETLLNELQLKKTIEITSSYIPKRGKNDYRELIHPKNENWKNDISFQTKAYTQVFFDRFEFHPNLSILDLLFNEGPNSISFIN